MNSIETAYQIQDNLNKLLQTAHKPNNLCYKCKTLISGCMYRHRTDLSQKRNTTPGLIVRPLMTIPCTYQLREVHRLVTLSFPSCLLWPVKQGDDGRREDKCIDITARVAHHNDGFIRVVWVAPVQQQQQQQSNLDKCAHQQS